MTIVRAISPKPVSLALPDGDLLVDLLQLLVGRVLDPALDLLDEFFGLALLAMDEHPAGTLGHVAAHQQDGDAEHRAEAESEPPAQVRGEEVLVEQDHRQDRAAGGAQPERPVDDQIDPTATRAGMSSSMAELMAAYSPPIPRR